MQDIHAIVYWSSAVRLLEETEIVRIIERARHRNAAEGITGVLLYSDGNFMQYIEGPYEPLTRVYQSIKDSPLHKNVIELYSSAVAAREFAQWSMAYRIAGRKRFLELSQASWLVDQLNPPSGSDVLPSINRVLLRQFWQAGESRRGV